MKKLRITSLALALMFGLCTLAACGGTPSSTPSSSAPQVSIAAPSDSSAPAGVSATDMVGRAITLDAPAEKVVALTAADCEILYAIGAGGTVVGRGEYCDYPAEVLDLPALQSGADTNAEQIIALEPQVVIMSTMAQDEGPVKALEDAGITVVMTDAQDIAGVYTAIELIGAVVGKADEAAQLTADMKAGFDEAAGMVPADAGETSVYFEIMALEYGPWGSGRNTFMNEIGDMLGLTNIFADIDGWAELSQEQVIERNPDVIVTTVMGTGDGASPVDEILGREGWQDITAVANSAIFNADNSAFTRPGPRLTEAAKALAEFVYGQ